MVFVNNISPTAVFALILSFWIQPSLVDDESSPQAYAVYAKIILPMKPPSDGPHPPVESWISKNLQKQGKTDLRAVTQWVRLAEKDEKSNHIWSAKIDGKRWGCPVVGKVVESNREGVVKAELAGWSPGGAEIKGQTVAAEIGSRRVAVVDTGEGNDNGIAYIAIFVGPALANQQSTEKQPAIQVD